MTTTMRCCLLQVLWNRRRVLCWWTRAVWLYCADWSSPCSSCSVWRSSSSSVSAVSRVATRSTARSTIATLPRAPTCLWRLFPMWAALHPATTPAVIWAWVRPVVSVCVVSLAEVFPHRVVIRCPSTRPAAVDRGPAAVASADVTSRWWWRHMARWPPPTPPPTTIVRLVGRSMLIMSWLVILVYTRCFVKRTPFCFFHNLLKLWAIYMKFLPFVAE